MTVNDDIKCVIFKDGKEIHLNDEGDISIVFNGKTLSCVPILYPDRGYAGGSLYLSPSNLYLLFSYYSGQSEEAFSLFRIGNELEAVYEMPYSYGEIASYAFSNNEGLLIQCLPNTCAEWWQPWLDKDTEQDENGNLYFDFGEIGVLDIENTIMSKHVIRIYPTQGWCPKSEEYEPFMFPKMTGDTLKISMPWGDEVLQLPLRDVIIFNVT